MKKTFLTSFFVLYVVIAFSQIRYEKGYFVKNDSSVVECYIRHNEWKHNPSEISYRLSPGGEVLKASLQDVQKFEILGASKYQRAEIKIDRSSDDAKNYSISRDPEWSEEMVFLKILADGSAKLWSYEDGEIKRFFYSVDAHPIEQLIFRRYVQPKVKDFESTQFRQQPGIKVYEDARFRQQLWSDVRCPNDDQKDFKTIRYTTQHLSKVFERYYNCNGEDTVLQKNASTKSLFNLKMMVGVSHSQLEVKFLDPTARSFEFERTISPTIGLELEQRLPFNRNKWAIFLNSLYTDAQIKGMRVVNSPYVSGAGEVLVDYPMIDLHLGGRYYMFLSNDFTLFLSSALTFNKPLSNSRMTFEGDFVYNVSSHPNLFGSLGTTFRRISLDFRHSTPRNIFYRSKPIVSTYSTTTLLIGYQLRK